MTIKLPKLIATSVVRGSQQGESHGGVYTIDFELQKIEQHIDWNTSKINFAGRGADRGLRGISIDKDNVLIAASDELFGYDRHFSLQASWRNRYLNHCHEICRLERTLFLTSTGHDSILAFDLDKKAFVWGFHLQKQLGQWGGFTFDPCSENGPRAFNDLHINMVHADTTGIYISGLRTEALLHINKQNKVTEVCSLPAGTHNARPFNGGVIFNDTASDYLRVVPRGGASQAFKIRGYDPADIQFEGVDDSKIARQAFGRGLCVIDDRFVAGGSSPSTVTLYDLHRQQMVASVNVTMDIRNAIHGLAVWPY
jgi:hypothetical protein